jgi:hypothetical protein
MRRLHIGALSCAIALGSGCGSDTAATTDGGKAGTAEGGLTTDGSAGGDDTGGDGSSGSGGDGSSGNDGASAGGELWSGILDPSRAVDWTHAGVVGGIPDRTTICATLNPGATAKQINAAITACPAGQVVTLTGGTYDIADDGIVMKSGITLRGAGGDKTMLVFTAVNPCEGGDSSLCFEGSTEWSGDARALPGGSNAASWTGGYARGSTQITLSDVGDAGRAPISVGQYIHLDQANDTSPGADFFVCDKTSGSCSLEGGNGGRVIDNILRSQVQIVQVTAVNGDTLTITPGLYSPNWRSSQSPGAWWASTIIQNAGVEDLSIDATNSGGQADVTMFNAANDWVKGVRLVRTCACSRDLIQLADAAHCTIENSYLFGTQGQSTNYGIEAYVASDNLIQNNVFQHVVAPLMVQPAVGSVYAFNYAINDTYDDGTLHWMSCGVTQHNGGVEYNLYEGNVGPGYSGDVFHGNQLMNTLFRNYLLGTDPGRSDATSAVTLLSYNRYHNVVGNVLGTPGYTTTYEAHGGPGQTKTVFNTGGGNTEGSVTVPDDPMVTSTLMRWGNYDVATGSVHFTASEVPSGITPYGNPVPASQALPPSFFAATKPSFWPASKAWPPIGPDVTGGNVSGLAGHATTNPAQDCFTNVMRGPADGSGAPLTFSAASCYP